LKRKDVTCTAGWYTSGTHDQLWGGELVTYQLIPSEALPPIDDDKLDGSFAWLPVRPEGDSTLRFEEGLSPAKANLARLPRLAEKARSLGLSVPKPFVTFLQRPEIHGRVPTCTACYLDLSERLLKSPVRDGSRMIRFLNDSQCCVLWYVYLQKDGQSPVMAGMPSFHEEEASGSEASLDDAVELEELVQVAPSFEAFVYRFWLENAIWYALHGGRPLTAEQKRYLEATEVARRALGIGLGNRERAPAKPWWKIW